MNHTVNNYLHAFLQIPIEQLNRASRLLLGALLEAHDILEQLHTNAGSTSPVQQQTKENIERVRRLSQSTSDPTVEPTAEEKKEEKPAAKVDTTEQISRNETSNIELPPRSTESDGRRSSSAAKASDTPSPPRPSSTSRPPMPDLVTELTTPTKTHDLKSHLPDLVQPTLPTPRKRSPPRRLVPAKTRRKVFRLSTLQELAGPRACPPSPMSWKEAGSKLAEVAGSWRSSRGSSPPPRRLPINQGVEEQQEGEKMTKTLVSSVVKIVSCVSLYLIVRKVESLLQ